MESTENRFPFEKRYREPISLAVKELRSVLWPT